MADEKTDRELIEAKCAHEMWPIADWREGDEGTEAVLKHRWEVTEDDEDEGLFSGDEGEVRAAVVGAVKYGNRRVVFSFKADGTEHGTSCMPFENVEPADA